MENLDLLFKRNDKMKNKLLSLKTKINNHSFDIAFVVSLLFVLFVIGIYLPTAVTFVFCVLGSAVIGGWLLIFLEDETEAQKASAMLNHILDILSITENTPNNAVCDLLSNVQAIAVLNGNSALEQACAEKIEMENHKFYGGEV